MNIDQFLTEFKFSTSKSSGKGGQHVNKTESRVELRWNFADSKFLTDEQKIKFSKLSSVHIIDQEILHFASELSRSQLKNKQDVIEKAKLFILKNITEKKKRKKSRVPASVKQKRLDTKKKRSEIKVNRRKL